MVTRISTSLRPWFLILLAGLLVDFLWVGLARLVHSRAIPPLGAGLGTPSGTELFASAVATSLPPAQAALLGIWLGIGAAPLPWRLWTTVAGLALLNWLCGYGEYGVMILVQSVAVAGVLAVARLAGMRAAYGATGEALTIPTLIGRLRERVPAPPCVLWKFAASAFAAIALAALLLYLYPLQPYEIHPAIAQLVRQLEPDELVEGFWMELTSWRSWRPDLMPVYISAPVVTALLAVWAILNVAPQPRRLATLLLVAAVMSLSLATISRALGLSAALQEIWVALATLSLRYSGLRVVLAEPQSIETFLRMERGRSASRRAHLQWALYAGSIGVLLVGFTALVSEYGQRARLLAGVSGAVAGLLACELAAWRTAPARRFQLSVASLMIVVAIAAVIISWPVLYLERERERDRIARPFRDRGARVEWHRPGVATNIDFTGKPLRDFDLEVLREHLIDWPGNVQLILRNTQITDTGLKHLNGIANLIALKLEGAPITDAGLEHLTGLPESLWWVELCGTRVTPEAVRDYQEQLRASVGRSLTIPHTVLGNYCGVLEWEAGAVVGVHIDHRIGTVSWQSVDDQELAKLVEKLKQWPDLRSLSFHWTDITDDGLVYLTQLSNLRELHHGSPLVTDRGTSLMKRQRPGLEITR